MRWSPGPTKLGPASYVAGWFATRPMAHGQSVPMANIAPISLVAGQLPQGSRAVSCRPGSRHPSQHWVSTPRGSRAVSAPSRRCRWPGLSSPRATLTIPGRTGPARTDIRVIPGRLPLELHVTQPILAGWRPATDRPVHETLLYPMMTDARLAERGTSQRTALEASGHTSDELPSLGRGLQPPRRQPPGPLPVDRPRSQGSR